MKVRIVVQRSRAARVTVADEVTGEIPFGLVLLVGVKTTDSLDDAVRLAERVAHLRIFEDESGRMNEDVCTVGGHILSISQFTLYGDARKGRRPNYMEAAKPEIALPVYEHLNSLLRTYGIPVQTGQFGAMMDVQLINDGPVTILLDSDRLF